MGRRQPHGTGCALRECFPAGARRSSEADRADIRKSQRHRDWLGVDPQHMNLRPSVSGAIGCAVISCALMAACSKTEPPRKMFEDVTAAAGLGGYTGMTHGAAWGDFDGDGLADLYITNHLNEPKL